MSLHKDVHDNMSHFAEKIVEESLSTDPMWNSIQKHMHVYI